MAKQSAHEYLTYLEISRQQKIWKNALTALIYDKEKNQQLIKDFVDRIWIFVGCGTSYYIAQTASSLFSKYTGIISYALPGSEILINPDSIFLKNKKYLIVPISRSGESTETVLVAEKSRKEFHIPTLAISCDQNSSLVKACDYSIPFPFEKEKSVVMTSSFTTLLLALIYIALILRNDDATLESLFSVVGSGEKLVKTHESFIENVAANTQFNDFIFLGQGPYYGIANEAALKMLEMSITNSTSFHTLEYRHGPRSFVSENSLITFLISSSGAGWEKPMIKEIKDLGGKCFVLHGEYSQFIEQSADFSICMNQSSDMFNIFHYVPLLQLLGFYRAVSKDINPDLPRYLSQVVTFEQADSEIK